MPVIESLWSAKALEASAATLPQPVAILHEQGEALAKQTDNLLYGAVSDDPIPTANGARYNFYISVTDKPHRYLLLSVEVGYRADYPVRLINHDASTTTRLSDVAQFKNALRLILNSPATEDILRRMMSLASASE